MPIETQTEFIAEAKGVLLGVRRALAELLSSVGADPTQPQEMSRRFGLDKTLTWKITRIICDEDIRAVIRHVPGKSGLRIFLDAMERSGALAERADVVRQAVADLERLIDTHSGDRDTLEAMIGEPSTRGAGKRMETFRKNGFQANSAVWGVQARLQLAMSLMVPGKAPDTVSTSTVCGLVGLRRLRSNVPWAVGSAVAWDYPENAKAEIASGPLPLYPDGLIGGVPALPQFCSDPLPELRRIHVPSGSSRFEITGGSVGKTAEVSVFLGWKWASDPSTYCEESPDELGEHGCLLSTPVEMFVFDLFVHRSLTFAFRPKARLYSDLPGGPKYPTEGREVGRLPMPEDVVDLGGGPPDTTTPEFPRYRELVEFGVKQMGCSMSDMHGFRYRLRYPPIPTMALLQHPLLVRDGLVNIAK